MRAGDAQWRGPQLLRLSSTPNVPYSGDLRGWCGVCMCVCVCVGGGVGGLRGKGEGELDSRKCVARSRSRCQCMDSKISDYWCH